MENRDCYKGEGKRIVISEGREIVIVTEVREKGIVISEVREIGIVTSEGREIGIVTVVGITNCKCFPVSN